MLVTRQERTLAVDGEWVHVRFLRVHLVSLSDDNNF
jgi:hypothetical protein